MATKSSSSNIPSLEMHLQDLKQFPKSFTEYVEKGQPKKKRKLNRNAKEKLRRKKMKTYQELMEKKLQLTITVIENILNTDFPTFDDIPYLHEHYV